MSIEEIKEEFVDGYNQGYTQARRDLLSSLEKAQVYIEQLRGALGYPVPGHIRENPEIKNGIADALHQQLESNRIEIKTLKQIIEFRDSSLEKEKERAERLERSGGFVTRNLFFAQERTRKAEERVKRLVEAVKLYRESHNTCIKGSPQGLCNKCRITEKVLEEVK